MRLRYAVLFALPIAVSLLAAGCATTGGTSAGSAQLTDSVSAVLLTKKQVQSEYGYSFSSDPFIAPGPSIMPTYYDFLVVKLTIGATKATDFQLINAKAEDLDGTTRADFESREDFTKYVDQVSMQGDPSATVRHDKVGWYYLPSGQVQVKRGWHSYVIVLIGKHPIGNNVTINLTVALGGNVQDIHIPVPVAENN